MSFEVIKRWFKSIKQFLINNSYLILFVTTLFIMEIVMRYSLGKHIEFFYMIKKMALTFSFANILFLAIPLVLLPKRAKKYYAIFLFFLTAVLMIVNEVHFMIFKDFVSCKQLVLLKEVGEFGGAGFNHFLPAHIILIVLAIVASILMVILLKKHENKERVALSIIILICAFIFYGLGQMQINRTEDSDWALFDNEVYIHDNLSNTKKAMHLFGFYEYTKQDVYINFMKKFLPENKELIQDIDTYFKEDNRVHQENNYTGILKNKNVIFVLAESLDTIAYNENLMPTLTMLREQSLSFENFFVPLYPRTTSDSEFISLTGLFPSIERGPTCYTFNRNNYRYSLANQLRNNGYTANSFHNNDATVYSRDIFHPAMGLEHMYDAAFLKLEEIDDSSDTAMYRQGKDLISPLQDSKFFSYIITISGHGDYNIEGSGASRYKEQVLAEYGDSYPQETLGYIAYQMELDALLSDMVNDLKAKNLFQDTVIVVMGDHYPYMMQEENYQQIKGTMNDYEYSRLPLIISNPSLIPEKLDQLVTTVDVVPTLMNLLGIEYDANYYFGKDAFDLEEENMVVFKDYSFYDGTTYYDSDFIKNGGNSAIYQSLKGKIIKKTDIFQKILRSDYFKHK